MIRKILSLFTDGKIYQLKQSTDYKFKKLKVTVKHAF